jgi:hypothetical protein
MEQSTPALDKALLNVGPSYPHGLQANTTPVQPIPFNLFQQPARDLGDSGQVPPPDIHSPTSSKTSHPPTSPGSEMSWTSSPSIGSYDKLSKGDVGYGGNAFASSPDGKQVTEGLLAKKLRDMAVKPTSKQDHLGGA